MKSLMINANREGKRFPGKCPVAFSKRVASFLGKGIVLTFLAIFCNAEVVLSQAIQADGSLSTGVSTGDGLNFTIDGGDRVGDNLFHSFEVFSVPTMGSAVFDNAVDITHIVGRVTGNASSQIDGLIKANGGAHLFLINPNGIVFEENAQLDIGGSFIGSTAESVQFEDGTEFSAVAPVSLLTMSAPVGLQMGLGSGEIQVNDAGYQVLPNFTINLGTPANPIPVSSSNFPIGVDSSSSLQVKPGNTIALVGSSLVFDGGTLAAPGGRVELGSVRQGEVSLTSQTPMGEPTQWILGYDEVQQFGDTELSSRSLLNTSDLLFGSVNPFVIGGGARGGSIQLQGEQISVRDGSIALIQNFGSQAFGDISVRAAEGIVLEGAFVHTPAMGAVPDQQINSGFATNSFGFVRGGDINIEAPQLYLTGGAEVITTTLGPAAGGNLSVNVTDSIFFELDNAVVPESGRIFSVAFGSGKVGDIHIETGQLDIEDNGIASRNIGSGEGGTVRVIADDIVVSVGASIASVALGAGAGGDLFVEADTIDVVGINPVAFLPANISVSTTLSGNAGNLTIDTQRLRLMDGGRVDASTFATGAAGTVTINATESVEVAGTVPGSINASLIGSTANRIDPQLRAFFAAQGIFVPASPSGAAGDVTVNTPVLTVRDGAEVTVRNDGSGDAGLLTANVDTIRLLDRGGITASTEQGGGGNIDLSVQDVLLMNREGQISAEAGNDGDGGNITLTTPVLIAVENSDIIANANQGTGGNIQINAQGIVGTEFREQLTPESDITASSQFGVSGEVSIASPDVDPSSGIVTLPATVAEADNHIVAGCSAEDSSQFIATGRGGLPLAPSRRIGAQRLWGDVRAVNGLGLAGSNNNISRQELSPTLIDSKNENSLAEATGWTSNERGELLLFAESASSPPSHSATCLQADAVQPS